MVMTLISPTTVFVKLSCSYIIITKQLKEGRINSKPWFTSSLNKSVQKKVKLYNKWLHTRSDVDLNKYKKYKNKLTSVLRNAEKLYYSNRFNEIQGNINEAWQIIKTILPTSSNKGSISEIEPGNNIISDKITYL